MKMKVEYSQIVRKKLKSLKKYLTDQFGSDVSQKVIKAIMQSARSLSEHPEKGVALAALFGIDTDFRYLFVNHNYLFYYIEGNKIIVAEMFNEREDFMYKLFGISSTTNESVEYWDEQ